MRLTNFPTYLLTYLLTKAAAGENIVLVYAAVMAGSEDRKVKTWYMSDISLISVIDDNMTAGVKVMTLSPNNTFLVVGG